MASILVLTPQLPYPPRQGTALRNWGLLRTLAERHDVSLLSFASPDQDPDPDPVLQACTRRIAVVPQPTRSLPDRLRDLVVPGRADLSRRLASDTFRARLLLWLSEYHFDWIQVEGLELAAYLDDIPSTGAPRVIFDDHNCEYVLQRRAARADLRRPTRWPGAAYSSIQWRRLRRFEARVCRDADVVIAVSKADDAALREIVPGLESLVIPNGIDVAAYAGHTEAVELAQPAFVFTGTMDFRPNVDGVLWFADEVWPRVRECLPGACLYLVGRHPHARLDRLLSVAGIVITGSVPDTRPYIRAATVYIVPLLVGGGTRLKLLESTAMGKAVVSTRLGAEGFVRPDEAMVLADDAVEFADACVRLVEDDGERARWCSRARAYATAYDWDRLLPPLLERLGS